MLLRLKMPVAARDDGERAIELNPDSARALKTRGVAKRYLGDYAGAAKDIGDAQKIDFDESLRQLQEFLANKVAAAQRMEAEKRMKEVEDKAKRAKERMKAHKNARKEHLRATGAKVDSSDSDDSADDGFKAYGGAAQTNVAWQNVDETPKTKPRVRAKEDDADKEGVDEMLDFLEQDDVDFWRCECCRKTFKSNAQYNQHLKSKKHKEVEKKMAQLSLESEEEDEEDDDS